MLALDSPRWTALNHAYGSAADVPDLIRAIAEETVPRFSNHVAVARSNPSPWEWVYSCLCHQYTVYSATYAAFPHIVAIANADGVEKRIETLLLAGVIRVHGVTDGVIPADLVDDFELAMRTVRHWSLQTVRSAKLDDQSSLPCLVQAFGALRHPKSAHVCAVERLSDGDCELEIDECPNCREYFLVEMTTDGPISMPCDGRGVPIRQRSKVLAVDRSGYPSRIQKGRLVLQRIDDPDWPIASTPDVLAALAAERGAVDLATRIIDVDASVACPACSCVTKLADALAHDSC
ncbi:MAG TPA: hypothetical protein VMP01_09405 [Pirellulaceae bacterium]|nr:hypothetical protein [Pirellulaceae bacterium]